MRTPKFLTNTICFFWTRGGKQKLVDLSGQSLVKIRQTWKHEHVRNCRCARPRHVLAFSLSLSLSVQPPFWSLLPKHCKLLTEKMLWNCSNCACVSFMRYDTFFLELVILSHVWRRFCLLVLFVCYVFLHLNWLLDVSGMHHKTESPFLLSFLFFYPS